MKRNILLFGLKFLISVALITFLVTKLDINQIGIKLGSLEWQYVLLSALCFMLLMVNNAMRWNVVLSAIDHRFPFGLVFKIQYMGGFFNQTLPSVIGGDAIRMYIIHKSDASLKTAINGIILERVITLSCLIFLVSLVQPFMILPADSANARYIFPTLSLIMVISIVVLTQMSRFPESLNKWKVVRAINNLANDAKKLFTSARYTGKALFFGLLGNILISVFTWQCAMALGIELSLTEALVLVPPAILVSTLPISIAGWGVREGAMVATLSMAGIAEVDAFTLSILFGLLMAAFSIPGGLIWLLHRNKA